jgi:putative heme-binding domain-containing protein
VLAPLFRNLADTDDIPAAALPLLIRIVTDKATEPKLRVDGIVALTKTDHRDAFAAIIKGMTLNCHDGIHRARKAFHDAPRLENHHALFIELAKADDAQARVAMEAVMQLASSAIGAPEPRAACRAALDAGWAQGAKHQAMMMTLVAPVLASTDKDTHWLADTYFKTLRLDPKKVTQVTPADQLIGALPQDRVLTEVVKIKGDPRRGEQLFTQQGCIACHTTKPEEKLKGPYLGNIAGLYKRRELAEAVLEPSKTIAQGFATHVFITKDGEEYTGFVVREAASTVTFRNLAAQEITLDKSALAKRELKEGVSLMPPRPRRQPAGGRLRRVAEFPRGIEREVFREVIANRS